MDFAKRSSLLAISLSLFVGASAQTKEVPTKKVEKKPFDWRFSGTFKPGDTFYGKNITFLNSCNKNDKILYLKHTLDLNADFACYDLVKARFSARNKAVWGSNEVAPTTTVSTKILDSVGQNHKHFIPRHIGWIREAWIEFSLNEAFGFDKSYEKKHIFTLGAFPFQLGRGIALGDAYAVAPDYIGFYSDGAVDQYAFGAKVSGDLVLEKLSYDLYGAILDNQSNSLSKTEQNILGQEYGRLNTPERGFGKINFLFAGRLNWTPVNDPDKGKLFVEPYFLYNSDPEQQVEDLADATSRLGTIGIATEYEGDHFEFGFDGALNFGSQTVKGWDRNTIELQNRNGQVQEVNSHVYVNADPINDTNISNWDAYKAPHVSNGVISGGAVSTAGSTAKGLVNGAVQYESMNGKSIGIATDLDNVSTIPADTVNASKNELFNATNRFRNEYKDKYKGFMFVTDAAWFICDRDVKIAATAGYASGDRDPNFDLVDGDYRGFIGLQELYAGKRVKSAFFLGSAGKLRLPLDTLPSEKQSNRFGALVSGFTNLAFVGTGVTWEPSDWEKSFSLNPNMIAFWQTFPDKAFDLKTGTTKDCCARSFLGLEFNLFLKKQLMCDLYFFGVGSIFVPGSHFNDVFGKPLNAAQQKILDRFDRTGYNNDPVPGLGNNTSYTINLGFEYKF